MTSDDAALPLGSYETPITRRVRERMEARHDTNPSTAFGTVRVESVADKDVEGKEARARYISALSYQLADRLTARLEKTRSAEKRIELINQIAILLDEDDVIENEDLLYSVYE